MDNCLPDLSAPRPVSRMERFHRQDQRFPSPLLTLMGAVLTLSLLFGLGGLRIYCLSMERKITSLDEKIQQAQEFRIRQERELASLLSPSRVYSYAHANLDMQNLSKVLVVKVPPLRAESPRLALIPQKEDTPWYNRLLDLFIPQASAND